MVSTVVKAVGVFGEKLEPPNVPSVGNLWLRRSHLLFGLACICQYNGDDTDV